VPVTLDPSVIVTNVGTTNPMRQIARVETITGSNLWEGVTSDGVTAAWAGEAVEVADGSPTLAQPTVNVEKAHAFIPFSIELGGDWAAFEAEMSRLFADSKDRLEAAAFVSGTGHASTQPEGLLVGATAVVTAAGSTVIATGDIYALKEALPPRFQPRARFFGSNVPLDRIRALTGPGSTQGLLWDDAGPSLLRKPVHEDSAMPTTMTSGSSILSYGDFTNYLIVDRVGMTVELAPLLFGAANRYPTGQRGLYMWWRVGAKTLTFKSFRTLKLA
jgi:HK97 family phage major capsid protein